MTFNDILISLMGFLTSVLPLNTFSTFLSSTFGYTAEVGSASFIALYMGFFALVVVLIYFVFKWLYIVLKNILF